MLPARHRASVRFVALTLVLSIVPGCLFGPDPLDPDVLYVQNDTPSPLIANVILRQDGATRWEGDVEVAPNTFERRDLFRGDGEFSVEVRLSDGRVTNATFRLAAGPEFVQVFVRTDVIDVATMHGD